jgi:hypothetical protein
MKTKLKRFDHKLKIYKNWWKKPERRFDLFTSPIFRRKKNAPRTSKHTRALARSIINTARGPIREQGGTCANSKRDYLNKTIGSKGHSLRRTDQASRMSQLNQHWTDEDNNHLSGSTSRPTSRPSSRPTSRPSSRPTSRSSSKTDLKATISTSIKAVIGDHLETALEAIIKNSKKISLNGIAHSAGRKRHLIISIGRG